MDSKAAGDYIDKRGRGPSRLFAGTNSNACKIKVGLSTLMQDSGCWRLFKFAKTGELLSRFRWPKTEP